MEPVFKKDFEKIAAYFRGAASMVYKEERLTLDEIFYLWQNLVFFKRKIKNIGGKS